MIPALQDPYLPNPFAPVEDDNQIALNEATGDLGCVPPTLSDGKEEFGFIAIHSASEAGPGTIHMQHVDAVGNGGPIFTGQLGTYEGVTIHTTRPPEPTGAYTIILHPDQAAALKAACGAIPDCAIVQDKIPACVTSTRPHGTTQDYMVHVDAQGHEGLPHVFDPGCVECMRAVTEVWTDETTVLRHERDAYQAKCVAMQDEIALLRKQLGAALQSKAHTTPAMMGCNNDYKSYAQEHALETMVRSSLRTEFPEVCDIRFGASDYRAEITLHVRTEDGRGHCTAAPTSIGMQKGYHVLNDKMHDFLRRQGYGKLPSQRGLQGLLSQRQQPGDIVKLGNVPANTAVTTEMLNGMLAKQQQATCMPASPGQPPNLSNEINACQAVMRQYIDINDLYKGSDK